MRTDLDHLPANKQRELERIVEILFDEFGQATENATGRRKGARILKIILFGSHARGDWVDATQSANQYKSDYDILVIVSQKELTDRAAYWAKAEERLIRAYTIEKTLRTPVNFIVHSLHEVNDGLAHGRVFFMEVAKDGLALYEADGSELATPKPKTAAQALAVAQEYFEDYYPGAVVWLNTSRDLARQKRPKEAAFLLHQATERLYAGLLLTLTYYTPYNHNIAFLRSLAEGLDRRLYGIWPQATHRERAMFQKLKEAYTKARYSKHYRISEEELTWLGARVEELGRAVHAICSERLDDLRDAAERPRQ
ncbi:nucleotidyltransferase [Sphingopyxis sp. Root214]|jgi:predicted nucleotidyltransferase|uniref:nucleotidyltransferase and HEPN domain-containing protein n=1 Tax=unclassified Sphingopyxis TaxID=2614943 RepID=UPI0006F38973|nr:MULTISPECIES: HEPN domain-containing protein [unclassified Sphingopyxis]KQZ76381.1 nucleotidyltransferase [Sphingopyxis sp. Root154]KRC09731.1 nucleotidyltransferase [Sphingopyxis sp. Root214]